MESVRVRAMPGKRDIIYSFTSSNTVLCLLNSTKSHEASPAMHIFERPPSRMTSFSVPVVRGHISAYSEMKQRIASASPGGIFQQWKLTGFAWYFPLPKAHVNDFDLSSNLIPKPVLQQLNPELSF